MASKWHTGRAWIYVDGQMYESGDDAKVTGVMGLKRNIVKGADVYGYTEEVQEATVVASFFHGNGLTLAGFKKMTDVTVVFKCDTGAVYTLANAWCSEIGDLTAKDGKVQVTFAAAKADETLS